MGGVRNLLRCSGLAIRRTQGYKPAIAAMWTAVAMITRRRASPDPAKDETDQNPLLPTMASEWCLSFVSWGITVPR